MGFFDENSSDGYRDCHVMHPETFFAARDEGSESDQKAKPWCAGIPSQLR